MKNVSPQRGQIWSATPTPFLGDGRVDVDSVHRLVAHHADLGVAGIMLCGTCGEGSWMREADKEVLVKTAVKAAQGIIGVAVQVTDNSAVRTLDNIDKAKAWGAQIAVVAAPAFFMNATPQRLFNHYSEIATQSGLPIGFYDRGTHSPYVLPEAMLPELLSNRNIVVVKDSSQLESRRKAYLAFRATRPDLVLYSGSEFDCDLYMGAGYDGLMLGGGIFNAVMARKIMVAVAAGDGPTAERLQARMNDLMYRVYGGTKIECWMTGLKELLVELGVFSTHFNLLGYPLTDHCREQIAGAVTGSDGLGYREEMIPANRSFVPLRR